MSERLIVLPTGKKTALYCVGTSLFFYFLDFELLGSASIFVAAWVVYLYMVPKRKYALELDECAVIAPVSGVIREIEKLDNHSFGYKVTIESSLFQNGVIFTPMSAESVESRIIRGTRVGKDSRLFEKLNETALFKFQNGTKKLEMTHRLKRSPFEVESFKESTKRLSSGTVCGFASNCVTTILLPRAFRFTAKRGEKLKASQQILGYFQE